MTGAVTNEYRFSYTNSRGEKESFYLVARRNATNVGSCRLAAICQL